MLYLSFNKENIAKHLGLGVGKKGMKMKIATTEVEAKFKNLNFYVRILEQLV